MSKSKEQDDRFARSNEVAKATIEQERVAREAKTESLRALRIAQEANSRPPIAGGPPRKPSSPRNARPKPR